VSMEKYGVEVAPKKPAEKVAGTESCTHPSAQIMREGDVTFCQACNKYLRNDAAGKSGSTLLRSKLREG